MGRAILITILAVVAFAIILVARMPASWLVPGPPAQIACANTDGTIWNGTCNGLTVQGRPFGDVTWQLHASRLLSARLAATVTVTGPAGALQADLESNFSGKDVTAKNVKAEVPLDPALIPQLPRDLHGNTHAQLALVHVQNGVVTELRGHIEARDIQRSPNEGGNLGSYSIDFPGGPGEPTGRLRDLGNGPLSVDGALRLTKEPGYDLQGTVATNSQTPPDLAKQLAYLGTPDAQGRRPFAIAATF